MSLEPPSLEARLQRLEDEVHRLKGAAIVLFIIVAAGLVLALSLR